MKLLTQGDDFGFTKGVVYGVIDAIENGILRNTGLFVNMPAAEYAADYIRQKDGVCFGIDFNIVAGPCVSDPKDIPDLVDEDGNYIRSSVRVKDPLWESEDGRRRMFPYDQTYRELRAQFARFIEMTGKRPGYLHAHSLAHENYIEAIRKISEEEGIPYSGDIYEKYEFATNMFDAHKTSKVFDPIRQLEADKVSLILSHAQEFLSHEYCAILGHPAYVDSELLKWTSLSLERMKDFEMFTDERMLSWVKDNDIELITYHDLC